MLKRLRARLTYADGSRAPAGAAAAAAPAGSSARYGLSAVIVP